MDQVLQEGSDRAQWCENVAARSEASSDALPYCARCGHGRHTGSSAASPPTLPAAALDAEPLGAEITETSALTSPIALILGAGIAAELVLPWALIGLSDMFLFNTPAWSMWAVFVTSPVITLVAVLAHLAIKGRARDYDGIT